MNRQKICIIGGSLTGLTTAICLSKLNCEIDLIVGKNNQSFKSNRTIAISQHNFDFLKKLDISKTFNKYAWMSSVMKLYTSNENTKFSEIFELNNENKQKKILYVLENSKINQLMMEKIKRIKNISLIKNEEITKISNSGLLKSIKVKKKNFRYNLIIICTGSRSNLIKSLFNDKIIKSSYDETSVTTILKHDPVKNNIVRQIFLDNEIIALLPINQTKTSIVLSLKKDLKNSKSYIKEKIKFYSSNYFKNIKFSSNIESRDLNFLLREKYFKDRTLLFGDALHVIHPFVGQGFNMILRDLSSLKKILEKKINLGLDIGSQDILSEFSDEVKASNFAFSISTDILKNSFSINNNNYKKIRNDILKNLNKNNFAKNIFFDIADKGIKF
tara:strand:- start:1244 stop:2404 length:1161 start_codon:yes stop_codon:yes gene_type:complete